MTASDPQRTVVDSNMASTSPAVDKTVIDAPPAGDPGRTQAGAGGETEGTVVRMPGQPAAAPAPIVAAAQDAGKVTQLGDFKLVKKLGQGGMGAVYLAVQVSLDRNVALKTLSKELAKKPDFVQRFLRECRSMAKLQHPNVVQVYAADSVQGIHFVAIEYVDGRSMQAWMDEKKRLETGDALHVVLVCAEALKHAHEQSMIHRDIKPDNILVTKKGVVKLADFGLAKALDEDVSMTASGVGMGTPLYMPPEQARNAKHVDQRTDIYALGCTLYYFLTGRLPFSGTNTIELITAKETGRFTPARKLNPDIPERLDLMIDKMLAKDPQHRYASCDELIRDLSGLELDHASLSFIDAPDAARVARSPGVARGRTTAAVQAGERPAAPKVEEDVWWVRHNNAQGRIMVSRLSTDQVRKGVRAGTIDREAKASRKQTGEFLPLGQFPAFATEMEALATREKATRRGRDLKEIYAQLDRKDRRQKLWRKIKYKFGGAVGLIVWLAVLGGIGYGGWWAYNTYVAKPAQPAPATNAQP